MDKWSFTCLTGSRAKELRRAIHEELDRSIQSDVQLFHLLGMYSNGIPLPSYTVDYDENTLMLMGFDQNLKVMTPLCLHHECEGYCLGDSERVLCPVHKDAYGDDDQPLPDFEKEIRMVDFGYEQLCSALDSGSMSEVYGNHVNAVSDSLAPLLGFTGRFFDVNPNWHVSTCYTEGYKQKLCARFTDCMLRFGRFILRSMSDQLAFRHENDKEWTMLCSFDGCYLIPTNGSGVCETHLVQQDWKAVVQATILNLAGKKDWGDLTELDIMDVKQIIQAQPGRKFHITTTMTLVVTLGEISVIRKKKRFNLCLNIAAKCFNIWSARKDRNITMTCVKCRGICIWMVILVYIPNQRKYGIKMFSMAYGETKSVESMFEKYAGDFNKADIQIVREKKIVGCKKTASSIAASWIAGLAFKQYALNTTFDFFTSDTPFGPNAMRFFYELLISYEIPYVTDLIDMDQVEKPDYLLEDEPLYGDGPPPSKAEPFIYIIENDAETYVGAAFTLKPNLHSRDCANYHYYKKKSVSRPIGNDKGDTVTKVAHIKNVSVCHAHPAESIIMFAKSFQFETKPNQPFPTNQRLSANELPKTAARQIQRECLKFGGTTFSVDLTCKEKWQKVLEPPETTVQYDPNAAPIHFAGRF